MSDAPPKTKPGAGPATAAQPAARSAPNADWSPRFRSLEEVDKTLIRLRQSDIELDLALISRIEDFLATLRTTYEPALSLAWLDAAENILRELSDRLDGLKEDHVEKLTELNPLQFQAELNKTEAQVRAELNALKGARFSVEKQAWRERIDKNLAALRLKQEGQAEKLQHVAEVNAERVVVRPSEEFWSAYSAWLLQAHDVLREHLRKLLVERWTRFIDEHVAPVVKPLDASFAIDLPMVPIDDLPNPVRVAAPYPTPLHYRDNGLPTTAPRVEADVSAPSEVIHAHEIDRAASGAAQGGGLGALQRFAPAIMSPLVMLVPGVPLVAKTLVGIVVAVPTVLLGMKKQRAVRRVVQAERVEKAAELLKKKLVDDFRKRMERHRMDVEAFVRDYNAAVQQLIFQRLSVLVDRELEQRSALLPQQKAELQARKQRLSARVQVLEGASRVMSSVLVELEMRRRVLRDEVTRRASEGGQ